MYKKLTITLIILILFVSGCVPYENLKTETINVDNDFINYYVLPGKNSNQEKLIIYLDGSGLQSVLGIKKWGIWRAIRFGYMLRKYSSSDIDLLIPEKMNIKQGECGKNNPNVLVNYTLDKRVYSSVLVIDTYLNKNKYENIYLIGYSEGAVIAPRVYRNLKNKEKIAKLVLISGGGLSQFESFKILEKTTLSMPTSYKNGISKMDSILNLIHQNPESINDYWLGWPYKRWAGFLYYRPIEDLKYIDIPILAVHGDQDINCPVESSRFIKQEFEQLGKNNLTYKEYINQDHSFNGNFETIINDIEKWLILDKYSAVLNINKSNIVNKSFVTSNR